MVIFLKTSKRLQFFLFEKLHFISFSYRSKTASGPEVIDMTKQVFALSLLEDFSVWFFYKRITWMRSEGCIWENFSVYPSKIAFTVFHSFSRCLTDAEVEKIWNTYTLSFLFKLTRLFLLSATWYIHLKLGISTPALTSLRWELLNGIGHEPRDMWH